MIYNLRDLKPYINCVAFINPLMLFHGSEYYLHPEKYNIKFTRDKDQLYKEHPTAVPEAFWYSENPKIDALERCRRYLKIADAIKQIGIPTTPCRFYNW